MVLAVVTGSNLRAMSPLTHETVTMKALSWSLIWSSTGPEEKKGMSKMVEMAVAARSTHRTPLFLSACFLKTS